MITEQQIIDSCPIIYRNFYDFECGNGWLPLIHQLSLHLENIVKKEIKTFDIDGELPFVQQVKEKFGGLRFYISHGTNSMFELIDETEKRCFDLCEICGSINNVETKGSGWIKTLCEECRS